MEDANAVGRKFCFGGRTLYYKWWMRTLEIGHYALELGR